MERRGRGGGGRLGWRGEIGVVVGDWGGGGELGWRGETGVEGGREREGGREVPEQTPGAAAGP